MPTQYDSLRISFDKMNTASKKVFIDKLKAMPNRTPEHMRFVAECEQKYNGAIGGGSTRTASRNDYDDLLDEYTDKTNNYSIADPVERLLAYFIDSLLFVSVFICFAIIGVGLLFLSQIAPFMGISSMFMLPLLIITLLAIQIRYWKKSTSFGKSKMKLYVVNKETGENISTGYMFLREIIGKWISGLILNLGFIWILIDKDKQGWHDKFVSSVVVKK